MTGDPRDPAWWQSVGEIPKSFSACLFLTEQYLEMSILGFLAWVLPALMGKGPGPRPPGPSGLEGRHLVAVLSSVQLTAGKPDEGSGREQG